MLKVLNIRFFNFMKINSTLKVINPSLVLILLFSYFVKTNSQNWDIRVIESDESGILLEYLPLYNQINFTEYNGIRFTNISFWGEVVPSDLSIGNPELKYRLITIRLPGLSDHKLEVINYDYETIENIIVPPVKNTKKDEEGNFISEYIMDNVKYSVNELLPADNIILTDIGSVRNAAFANLKIYPIQFNPAEKKIKKFTRIVLRLNYGSREYSSFGKEDDLLSGIGINYTIAKNWFYKKPFEKKTSQINSVLSTGTWYRFEIKEAGIYKITGNQLFQVGFDKSVNPNTIKIYNNGGFELPFSPTVTVPDDLIENAIYVYDGGVQNQLDETDYILFYGKGTSGWKYNPTTKTYFHYIHHFSDKNIYWLTYGGENGKRMIQVQSLQEQDYFQPNTVLGMVFREEDKVNILNSGIEWLGQPFSVDNTIVYVNSLPSLNTQQQIRYKIMLAARTHLQLSSFTAYERDQILGSVTIQGTNIGSYGDPQAKFAQLNASMVPNFTEPRSELKLKFTSLNPTGTGYLDWYEIFYGKNLNSQNDIFNFYTHDTAAVIKYSIHGFSSNDIKIFDVSDFQNAKMINTNEIVGGSIYFQLLGRSGQPSEIYVIGTNGYKSVENMTRVVNQNIHGTLTSGDSIQFIIITHKDFKNAAAKLKNHRENFSKNLLKTLVVDIDEVYNEFGGGIPSPMAIRNFLMYAYNSIPGNSLKYVLLFGDGDYDYKRITTSGPNWIPPWETQESFVDIYSYASDDYFAIFDTFGRVSLAVGRLTARSSAEANSVVDKIIEYEKNPVLDPWKMRVTYVADDGPAATGENDGTLHTAHAEDIAAVTPDLIEKRKIYIVEHPTVLTATGRRKPTANQAIVSQMNSGTLMVNFSGHGNPRLWTHEWVFVRETDFPLLKNKGKYFYLIAATCNFSQFDGTGDQSGGEMLMNNPSAGAIGVFSATRAVYAAPNRQMNIELFRQVFRMDAYGNIIANRLGDGIYKTKQIHRDDNAQKYFLLGDPSTLLALPALPSTIDSINGTITTSMVDLKALQKVKIDGTIRDPNTNLQSNFIGKAQIVVYDANKKILFPDWYNFSYVVPGGVIFKGESSINNGKFSSEFIIPKDISYDTLNGRITVYFSNQEIDGMGYTENFRIIGTDTTAVLDKVGPEINIYLDSHSFRPGDVVSETPLLIVDLKDESGVNFTGSGIGHRLEAWLDDQTESINLNAYYKSKLDSYQEGFVEYRFGKLAPGPHIIKIRAWDVYNNSSTSTTIFNVLIGEGLTISDVYNYPNPFSEKTLFTFKQSQIMPVDVDIKIYSVAGRLLNVINRYGVQEKLIRIEWDGRDKDGDKLSNGVYLYKIIVRTQDGRFTSEAIEKLIIMR